MKKLISSKKEQLLYIETARQRIAEVLFRYPDKEFSLSELAKGAKVKKANIGVMVDELHKIGFIEIVKLTNIWRIKANRRSWRFMRSKIVYNLNFVYQSNLIEFLNDHYRNPKAIILFGSFGKGEDISISDIDIAIETDNVKEYATARLKQLAEFEETIGRRIQLHLFNRGNININVFNNIANGIILFGFLEVKP